MSKFLYIAALIFLAITSSGISYANELDEELQAVQVKLETLSTSEDTAPQKQLRDIYNKHQQILLDHQAYLKKTENYAQQLKQQPKQLEALKNQEPDEAKAINLETLAALPLDALQQQYITDQANLADLQNKQQKLSVEISQFRQRTISIRDEQAATSALHTKLTEKSPEKKGATDQAVLEAEKNYRDAQLRALTDKIRMLELEALVLPNAIEIIDQQTKLTLAPQIQILEQQIEALANEINHRKQTEAEQTVEKSQQLLFEKDWQYPALEKFAQDNRALAKKLSHYTELSAQLANRKTGSEKHLALISQSYTALQQRLELKSEDAALGTEVRKQFKKMTTEPDTDLTEKELNDAQLELFKLEQEKLQMMNERNYFKQLMSNEAVPPENTLAYQQLVDMFHELQQSREQIITQFTEVLHNYIKEQQLHQTIQQKLIEKINQHKLLLRENLLVTRSAKPISADIIQDMQDALGWFTARKTQDAIGKIIYATWKEIMLVFSLCALLVIALWRTYHTTYTTWVRTGNSSRGKVNQDKLRYPIGMLVTTLLFAACIALPFQLSALILQYQIDTEISQAISASLHVTAVALFICCFLLLLSRPEGLLIGQFQCPEKLVHKMNQDVWRFSPFIIVLLMIIAFTDALDDDQIRNGLGRLTFILFCLLVAILSAGWMAITQTGKALYQHMTFRLTLNPRLWMSLLFITQVSMIALAAVGYYYAALYQYQLIFQSISWLILCGLIFFTGFRSLLIGQRQIAFRRVIEKREEMLAQRSTSGKGEITDLLDDNYIDIKTISKQSATLLKISIWLLLLTGLGLIWVDMLPALSFLEKITIWHTSTEIDGNIITETITLKTLLIVMIILGLVFVAAHNLPGTLELLVLRHLSLDPGTGYAITTLLRYAIVITGIMVALQKLGMEWSNIQWLVAALSVGLGFGLQEVFANFVSGLILLFERPIRIGDIVTLNNISGKVSKIHIRATTLLDADRKEIIVPNKIFITQQLTNWNLSDQITRVVIRVRVTDDADSEKVSALLLEIARNHPSVLHDPEPAALLLEFGNGSLNFELWAFCGQIADRIALTHDLHIEISRRFAAENIQLVKYYLNTPPA